MNIKEAERYSHLFAVSKDFEAHSTLPEKTAYARGFIEATEKFKPLEEYLEHTRDCIRSFNEAGEPMPDGGYRQKFKGKWYQAKPIDETPKCDCGLDNTFEIYRRDILGKGGN